MRKRIFLLIWLFSLSIFQLSAQKIDQLTLKNGSIIRGNIVEIIPGDKVTINDNAGNTWVFIMEEIELIQETSQTIRDKGADFSQGWSNTTSIGFLAGSQNSNYIAPFSIQNTVGYRNNLGVYTGVLTGLEFLNVNHVPLMIDVQYALRSTNIMPFIVARGGYALPTQFDAEMYGNEYTYDGGPTGALGVGLKVRGQDIFAWEINLLYRYMMIRYAETYEWSGETYKYKDIYNRIELRVGVYLGK